MEEDELKALRGVGRRELLPPDGLPFARTAGSPSKNESPIMSMSTQDALALVAWDFDPVTDAIVNGEVRVSDFFEAFKWSDVGA